MKFLYIWQLYYINIKWFCQSKMAILVFITGRAQKDYFRYPIQQKIQYVQECGQVVKVIHIIGRMVWITIGILPENHYF